MSLYNQNMSCYCIENKYDEFWGAITNISDSEIKKSIFELLKPYEGSFMYFTESKDLRLLTLNKSGHVEFVPISRWKIEEIENRNKGFLSVNADTSKVELNPSLINKLNNMSGIFIGNKELGMNTFIELKFFLDKVKIGTAEEIILGSRTLSLGTGKKLYVGTQLVPQIDKALLNLLKINADNLKLSVGQKEYNVLDATATNVTLGKSLDLNRIKLGSVTVESLVNKLDKDRGDINDLLEISKFEAPVYPLYLSTDDIFGSMMALITDGLTEGSFDLCMHIEDPKHQTCYDGYLSRELSWKLYNLLDFSFSNFNLYVQPYELLSLTTDESKPKLYRVVNLSSAPVTICQENNPIVFNITNHSYMSALYFRPLTESINDSKEESFTVVQQADGVKALLQYTISSSGRKEAFLQVDTDGSKADFKPVPNAQNRSSSLKYDISTTSTTSAPERFNRLLYKYITELIKDNSIVSDKTDDNGKPIMIDNLKGFSVNIMDFLKENDYNVYFTARILKRIKVNVDTNFCIKPFTLGAASMNSHKLDFGTGVTDCNFAIITTGTNTNTLNYSATFHNTADIWGISGIKKNSVWDKLHKDLVVEPASSSSPKKYFNPEISPILYTYQSFTDTYRYNYTGQEQPITTRIDRRYAENVKEKLKGMQPLSTAVSPAQIQLKLGSNLKWEILLIPPTVAKGKDGDISLHYTSDFILSSNPTVAAVVENNFSILEEPLILGTTEAKFSEIPSSFYVGLPELVDFNTLSAANTNVTFGVGIIGDSKTLAELTKLQLSTTNMVTDKISIPSEKVINNWWSYDNLLKYYNKSNDFTIKSMFEEAIKFTKTYQKYLIPDSPNTNGMAAPVLLPMYRFDTSGYYDWKLLNETGEIIVDNDNATKILFKIPVVIYTGRPGASSFFIFSDAYYSISNTLVGALTKDYRYRGISLNNVQVNPSLSYNNQNQMVYSWINDATLKATDEFKRLMIKSEIVPIIGLDALTWPSKLSFRKLSDNKQLLKPTEQLSPGLLLSNSLWNAAKYINLYKDNSFKVEMSGWLNTSTEALYKPWLGWNKMYQYFNYLYYEAPINIVRLTGSNELNINYFTISIN